MSKLHTILSSFKPRYDAKDVLASVSQAAAQHIELDLFAPKVLGIIGRSLGSSKLYIYIVGRNLNLLYTYTHGTPREAAPSFDVQLLTHSEPVLLTSRLRPNSQLYTRLQTANIEAVARLATANGVNGYIAVGRKPHGAPLSRKDSDLLSLVSNEIALAIENSLRYEEIRQFSETLRRKVEDATAELRASNKKLKAMDQTKDEFISLTSHQLRTPLTTIKGYLSMLLDGDAGEVTPQQRKLLEEAFNSSQRMAHLISDFLNISRIQTGKFEIELSDVNLADVLDEEISQLRISASSRGLTLDYDKPEHFPLLSTDEGKLRQVMMNFIDNAIYYSPSGSSIRIVLRASAAAIEFTVIDHGIGVPKDEQHKLFTKFSRASNAKKQRPDGTGIGLFMAKKVIVALGGVIIFESKEGAGSTFGFRLNRS